MLSSRSARSRVRSSLNPERTHTRRLFHPSFRAASSRRNPQMRYPPGVIVTGWRRPTRSSEFISGLRSPVSRRCRSPTWMESMLRWSSTWPRESGMDRLRWHGGSCGDRFRDALDEEQLVESLADEQSLEDSPARCRAAEVGVLAVSYTHLRAHETDSYLVCRL